MSVNTGLTKCRENCNSRSIPFWALPYEALVLPGLQRPSCVLVSYSLTLKYSSPYILNDHAWVKPFWRIAMSEFTVCTFTTLPSFTIAVPVSGEGGPALAFVRDSDFLLPFLFGVCTTLEKIGVIAVLENSGLDMLLEYLLYCCICYADRPWCTSSWALYHFSMAEVSVSANMAPIQLVIVMQKGNPTENFIIPPSHIRSVQRNPMLLSTIQDRRCRWMFDFQSSQVSGLKELLEGFQICES